MSNPILMCQNVGKTYHDGTQTIDVLTSIDLVVNPGDRIAIIGPSGSGKSTLLHLLGGLDKVSHGTVALGGEDWSRLSEKKRCKIRNQKLGFVYQFHHLLPELTALENVMMPMCLGDVSVSDSTDKARELLTQLGLKSRLTHKPAQLSGGERQRVAIARALVHEPLCVLADEPTGNLDTATAKIVFEKFLALNAAKQCALIIVTHDLTLAKQMDRVLMLEAGRLVST